MQTLPRILVVYASLGEPNEVVRMLSAGSRFRCQVLSDDDPGLAAAVSGASAVVALLDGLPAAQLERLHRARDVPLVGVSADAGAATDGLDELVLWPPAAGELAARVERAIRRTGPRAPRPAAARSDPPSQLLLELTRSLVSSADFREILYTLVSRIATVVDVDRVSIVLCPDAEDVGYVVAASDDDKLTNLRLDLGKYPEIKHVLRTSASLTIEDVGHHPLLDEVRPSLSDAGLSSLTLLPLVWETQAVGVLFIRARTQRGALTDAQRGFCEVLANATAIALRSARMLQTLRDESQRDVYARIEAERRLSSLRRYADLLASAADGLAAFDASGRLLFANPSAAAILGHDPKSYLGKTMRELVAPEERRNLVRLRRRMAGGDFPHDVDIHIRSGASSSEPLIINGSFAPLSGTEGAALLSFRDVTRERKTRDELIKTRNFLQSLIDASVDAIVAAELPGGTIILFNAGAQELYGYQESEAIGRMNVRALYPGDGAREVMRMLRSRTHGGYGRLEPVRIEAIDKGGNIFPISLTAAMIFENGVPTATFGIFTDLRERVRVEQQLAQAQEKLAMSEKQALVAELAGATAHELNQPLTSVMGYSELLTRKLPQSSRTHRAADVIHREAQRMAEIVRKIGKLTRYETKSYVGEQKILDLNRASDEDAEPAPPRDGD